MITVQRLIIHSVLAIIVSTYRDVYDYFDRAQYKFVRMRFRQNTHSIATRDPLRRELAHGYVKMDWSESSDSQKNREAIQFVSLDNVYMQLCQYSGNVSSPCIT